MPKTNKKKRKIILLSAGILILIGVLTVPIVSQGAYINGVYCRPSLGGTPQVVVDARCSDGQEAGTIIIPDERWGLIWPDCMDVENKDYCEINAYGSDGKDFCDFGWFGGGGCPHDFEQCIDKPGCISTGDLGVTPYPVDETTHCPFCHDPYKIYAKLDSCPSTTDYIGQYGGDADALHGTQCRAVIDDAWSLNDPKMWGVWDAADFNSPANDGKCVVCSTDHGGHVEYAVLGDTTEVKMTVVNGFPFDHEFFDCDLNDDGTCEVPNGDQECERACGAAASCDEISPGTGGCSDDCQEEIPPPPPDDDDDDDDDSVPPGPEPPPRPIYPPIVGGYQSYAYSNNCAGLRAMVGMECGGSRKKCIGEGGIIGSLCNANEICIDTGKNCQQLKNAGDNFCACGLYNPGVIGMAKARCCKCFCGLDALGIETVCPFCVAPGNYAPEEADFCGHIWETQTPYGNCAGYDNTGGNDYCLKHIYVNGIPCWDNPQDGDTPAFVYDADGFNTSSPSCVNYTSAAGLVGFTDTYCEACGGICTPQPKICGNSILEDNGGGVCAIAYCSGGLKTDCDEECEVVCPCPNAGENCNSDCECEVPAADDDDDDNNDDNDDEAPTEPLCEWIADECNMECDPWQRKFICGPPAGHLTCSGGCFLNSHICVNDNSCLLGDIGCECDPDTCCINEYCVEENCTATSPDPDCCSDFDAAPCAPSHCDLILNQFSKGDPGEAETITLDLSQGEEKAYIVMPMGAEVCDTKMGITYQGPPLAGAASPLADSPLRVVFGGQYPLFAPSAGLVTSGLSLASPYDSSNFAGDLINFSCPLEMLLEHCDCPGCSPGSGDKWGVSYCRVELFVGTGNQAGNITLSLSGGGGYFVEYTEPPIPLFPGGLVLCGRHFDDPTTNIDETRACTLCHAFMETKRIIDFALLKILFPLVFALIVIGSGFFILAGGSSKKIAMGKTILNVALKGMIIAFGGWLIIETLVVAFTPNGKPWNAWDTIVCPVAPCDEVDSSVDDDICETFAILTSKDEIEIGTGEDAQTCPNDCAYNLLEGKNTEDIDWAVDVWPASPGLRGCDFDGECEIGEEIDGMGGAPEACPDCSHCGDGIVDIGEQCDGGAFRQILANKIAEFGGDQTCDVFAGYSGGTFNCDPDCKINMKKCEQK